MAALDPVRIFTRLCADIPDELRSHVIVTGSLAAAYEYRVQLQSQAVNTKDADLVVHPAGDIVSAQHMAERLLDLGWRPTDKCKPSPNRDHPEQLSAIRLIPPGSTDYFVELLNVPTQEQAKAKQWIPVQVRGRWYGLPSFKFMGLTALYAVSSVEGLEYASGAMMALANLLSHPRVTDDVIESGEFTGLRRCAKDLGRVIALAALAGRESTSTWTQQWLTGLQTCFPDTWREHGGKAGAGLREMIDDNEVMEQARKTTEAGLLQGRDYDIEALRGFGRRLLLDAIEELEAQSRSGRKQP